MSRTRIAVPLRRQVYTRARGCCAYCLIPETATYFLHQIDHIIPEKHGGPTEANNLALACILGNKLKGSDLASIDPETGVLAPLFNPRQQRWADHFRMADALIVPVTLVARATVRVLQLNAPDRLVERRMLLVQGLLPVPS